MWRKASSTFWSSCMGKLNLMIPSRIAPYSLSWALPCKTPDSQQHCPPSPWVNSPVRTEVHELREVIKSWDFRALLLHIKSEGFYICSCVGVFAPEKEENEKYIPKIWQYPYLGLTRVAKEADSRSVTSLQAKARFCLTDVFSRCRGLEKQYLSGLGTYVIVLYMLSEINLKWNSCFL